MSEPNGGIPASPDEKYITFKRNDFYELMGKLALPSPQTFGWNQYTDCAAIAQRVHHEAESVCVADAVVIRTHDAFAGPALHAYCDSITLVIKAIEQLVPEPEDGVKEGLAGLISVSDYLHQRAVEADAWDYKRLPD